MPEFTGRSDLRSYLRVLWRWKLLFVALLVAAPLATYLLERGKPKLYRSSALVSVANISVPGTNFSTGNIQAIARLLTTTEVADLAGQKLTPPTSGAAIVGEVSASADPITDFITITATDQSPVRAAEVANAFAAALNSNQEQQAIAAVESQMSVIRVELNHTPKSNPNWAELQSQLGSLNTQLDGLRSSARSKGSTSSAGSGPVQVIQAAAPDDTPVGPHLRRSVELGVVIGLLLAFGAVMLVEGADRRMHSPDDIESLTDLPILAALAPSAFSNGLEWQPSDAEAFQTLRTSLTYFTPDREIRSVLITSPGEREGKSTVASGLALAAAHTGLDVILLDADLRRRGATLKFDLAERPGLSTLLLGHEPPEMVLAEWPLPPDSTGHLWIMPAGSPPPNPAALISSEQMGSLLHTLEHRADLVIVDTPAGLAVSDAVPLMKSVSGVVLLARINHSSREAIHRLHKIISSARGQLLGVVATGVAPGPGYEHYSSGYYSAGKDGKRASRSAGTQEIVLESVNGSSGPGSPQHLQQAPERDPESSTQSQD